MNDKAYYLGFSVFEGIGPRRLKDLLKVFGDVKSAWRALDKNAKQLQELLGNVLADKFMQFRKTFSIEAYQDLLNKRNIQYLTIEDKEYPELLRRILSPPFLLYVKGDISLLNYSRTIAIVGTRKITAYGKQVTELLVGQLVQARFAIISGLAFGVDACAHEETIRRGGKTIAVLGCGVDCCTPVNNQYIYDQILVNGGTIISSFLPGQGASKGSFPARNAIIAGLSLGVVVTEGSLDSGALITASKGFLLQRPVFAVPGPITSDLSQGPIELLKKGATLVTDAKDILRVLKLNNQTLSSSGNAILSETRDDNLNKDEEQIIFLLQSQPLHFDEIARKIGKPASELGVLLSMMEVKGIIRNKEGEYSI